MPVRIQLDLPPGGSQRAFLDYFNAALRVAWRSGYSSTGTIFERDGAFVYSTRADINTSGGLRNLLFELCTDGQGVLKRVEITEQADSDLPWLHEAAELVTKALADALSDRKHRFFRRHAVHYVGCAFDGEYWFDGGRFAPTCEDDTDPLLVNAERVVTLDFVVDAIDDLHASSVARGIASRYVSRLALVLGIRFYEPEAIQSWVIAEAVGADAPRSARLQLGFVDQRPRQFSMPRKGELCRLGKYSGSLSDEWRPTAGQLATFPIETRRIFRALRVGTPLFRETVDTCARMYHLGLQISRFSITAGLAYHVAAVDAICQSGRAFDSPADFVHAYIEPTQETEVLMRYLYSDVRSAHFHAGCIPLDGVSEAPGPLSTFPSVRRPELAHAGFGLLRRAILRWLLAETAAILSMHALRERAHS
jgi:hypothetical protein